MATERPGMKTVGVIGLGSIGLRHAKNLLAMGHWVCAYDPIMPDGGIDIPFRNIEDMWGLDGVVIASPTPLHLEHIQATEDLITFVEKPIAHVLPAYAGHVKMVGNNLRFHSCVKKAKEWLSEGRIGTVQWANFTLGQYNDKYKDHVILNWGSHEIDLATYLLGAAEVAGCVGDSRIADIVLRHPDSGVRTSIHLDYVTDPEIRSFCIAGNEGNIHVDLKSRHAYLSRLGQRGEMQGKDSWDDNYVEEMEEFIKLIDGKPSLIAATGQDGLRTLELCLKAMEMCK